MDLDRTAQKPAGDLGGGRPPGSQPRRGGAMAGASELAGARGLLVSEHRFKKEKHRDAEKLHANSPRGSVRPEKE